MIVPAASIATPLVTALQEFAETGQGGPRGFALELAFGAAGEAVVGRGHWQPRSARSSSSATLSVGGTAAQDEPLARSSAARPRRASFSGMRFDMVTPGTEEPRAVRTWAAPRATCSSVYSSGRIDNVGRWDLT